MTLIVSALVTLMVPGISRAQGNGAASVGNMNLNLKKAIEIALAENPTPQPKEGYRDSAG